MAFLVPGPFSLFSTISDVLSYDAGLKSPTRSGINAIERLYVEFPLKEVP
jgi:hypothetical protein